MISPKTLYDAHQVQIYWVHSSSVALAEFVTVEFAMVEVAMVKEPRQ